MRYPGGKGGAGVYQTIINNIPPHDTYIETHLGGGNILERKRPAARSVGKGQRRPQAARVRARAALARRERRGTMEKQQAATPRHPGTAGISKRSAQARICDQGRSCVKDRRRMAVIRHEARGNAREPDGAARRHAPARGANLLNPVAVIL